MSYPFEEDPSAYQLRLYDGGPDYESWLWQIQRAAFRRKVWDYAVCAYEIPALPAKHAPMPIHLDYLRHRAGDGEMRQFFLANVSRPIQEHIKDFSTSRDMLQQLNRMYGGMAFIRRENQFYSFKKDPDHSIPDYLRALAIGFDRLRAISPRLVARDTFKYQFVRGLPSEWSLFGKLVLNHIDRLKTKEFFNVFVQEETNRLLNGVIRPPPRKPSHHPMETFRGPIQGLVVRSRPSRQLVEPPRILIPPGNSIMPMQNAPSSNPMAVIYNTGGPLDYFSMNELISSPQPSVSFASQSPQNEPSLLSGDEDGYESPQSLASEASTLKAPYDSCEDRMKAPDHSEESMKILDQLQEATEEDVEDAVEAPNHLEQPVKALKLHEENLPTPGQLEVAIEASEPLEGRMQASIHSHERIEFSDRLKKYIKNHLEESVKPSDQLQEPIKSEEHLVEPYKASATKEEPAKPSKHREDPIKASAAQEESLKALAHPQEPIKGPEHHHEASTQAPESTAEPIRVPEPQERPKPLRPTYSQILMSRKFKQRV